MATTEQTPQKPAEPAKTKILKPKSTEQKIDESVDESFPASDPPSWSGSTAKKDH